jgi:hypothetical protein
MIRGSETRLVLQRSSRSAPPKRSFARYGMTKHSLFTSGENMTANRPNNAANKFRPVLRCAAAEGAPNYAVADFGGLHVSPRIHL